MRLDPHHAGWEVCKIISPWVNSSGALSFLESAAQWWANRLEPGGAGNGKGSTPSLSAKLHTSRCTFSLPALSGFFISESDDCPALYFLSHRMVETTQWQTEN